MGVISPCSTCKLLVRLFISLLLFLTLPAPHQRQMCPKSRLLSSPSCLSSSHKIPHYHHPLHSDLHFLLTLCPLDIRDESPPNQPAALISLLPIPSPFSQILLSMPFTFLLPPPRWAIASPSRYSRNAELKSPLESEGSERMMDGERDI